MRRSTDDEVAATLADAVGDLRWQLEVPVRLAVS